MRCLRLFILKNWDADLNGAFDLFLKSGRNAGSRKTSAISAALCAARASLVFTFFSEILLVLRVREYCCRRLSRRIIFQCVLLINCLIEISSVVTMIESKTSFSDWWTYEEIHVCILPVRRGENMTCCTGEDLFFAFLTELRVPVKPTLHWFVLRATCLEKCLDWPLTI